MHFKPHPRPSKNTHTDHRQSNMAQRIEPAGYANKHPTSTHAHLQQLGQWRGDGWRLCSAHAPHPGARLQQGGHDLAEAGAQLRVGVPAARSERRVPVVCDMVRKSVRGVICADRMECVGLGRRCGAHRCMSR